MGEEFTYPSRDEIKDKVLEITEFSREEVEELSWDELYEVYGRVEKYGEEEIEDEYRS